MTILSIEEAKKQARFHKYGDGVYRYQTADGFWHFIIGGEDVLAGLNVIHCHYYRDGVCRYQTADRFWHLIIGGKDVLEGLKAVACYYRGDGVCEYITEGYETHEGKVDLNKGERIMTKTKEDIINEFIAEKPEGGNTRSWCKSKGYQPISLIEMAVDGYVKHHAITQRTAVDMLKMGVIGVNELKPFWKNKEKPTITEIVARIEQLEKQMEEINRKLRG